jgi:hypothetical protein
VDYFDIDVISGVKNPKRNLVVMCIDWMYCPRFDSHGACPNLLLRKMLFIYFIFFILRGSLSGYQKLPLGSTDRIARIILVY